VPSDRIALSHGAMTAEIGPAGGVILALSHRREDRTLALMRPAPPGEASDPLASACFPLVPFGNRLRGNAFVFEGVRHAMPPNHSDPCYMHGDGWLSSWTVGESSARRAVLTLRHVGDGPYHYEAEQDFALGADGLTVTLGVRNLGAAALPFGLGLHPYFPLTPATTLRAVARRTWREAEDHLPGEPIDIPADLDFSLPRALPRRWINSAFDGWDGRADITWPEWGARLAIQGDPGLVAYVLFAPDPSPPSGRGLGYFCLEPMTHVPGGHAQPDLGGLRVLAPGESMRCQVLFRCAELTDRDPA
jgi:aldose 1-epimerase